MSFYDYPPECANEPDMPKIMAYLYELWFREHGAEVKVTVRIRPDGEETTKA